MEANGYGGALTLDGEAVTITRPKMAQRAGYPASLRIPLDRISDVKFTRANPMVNGQLTIVTDAEPNPLNLIVRYRRKDIGTFEAMRDAITQALPR